MKWSPLLGVLNFRLEAFELEIWIVHYSSIHHDHRHCYWIPPTAMIEWVASVIWGRAKTGTAVSRYNWVLMEMRILKTNHYHKNIEGKQCKLDSSWGWPCNKSFLLSKTSLDYKWTCVSARFTFLLLKKLCMGSTFSFEGCSLLLRNGLASYFKVIYQIWLWPVCQRVEASSMNVFCTTGVKERCLLLRLQI